MCGWISFLPHLLTRFSESSNSWPRSKSKIIPFPKGLEWQLVIKSGTTPGEDIGEEPSLVYDKPRTWGGTHTYAVSRSLAFYHITLKASQPQMDILGKGLSLYREFYIVLCLSNKYVKASCWGKKKVLHKFIISFPFFATKVWFNYIIINIIYVLLTLNLFKFLLVVSYL